MRAALSAMAVPFLICGCGCPRVPDTVEVKAEPDLTVEVRVPEAQNGRARDHEKIYLNVNEQGEVVLAPDERFTDAAGNNLKVLNTTDRIALYLNRKAAEDQAHAHPRFPDDVIRSIIVLRVDARTPFEKTHGILKASRDVGYTQFYWRVMQSNGYEAVLTCGRWGDEEETAKFTARVISDAKGRIEKLTLRGDGIEKELDFKADIATFTDHLKTIASKNKDEHLAIVLEIDGKLLQGELIKLIDTAAGADFWAFRPRLIESAKQ